MQGEAKAKTVVLFLLLSFALSCGLGAAGMVLVQANANASQSEQIAIHQAAIIELRELVKENKRAVAKMFDQQEVSTQQILTAIRGIK
jgi:hypothetical protein